MKILKTQVLRGPNIWSNYRKKLIQIKLDLEEMESFPTDLIPGFKDRIMVALPTLIEHECSENCRGGFFIRLERGTWLGHVMEHVALEIQSLAGMETGYGRTRETAVKGVYNMVFSYQIEQAGLYAAKAAFRIVKALAENEEYQISNDIEELVKLRKRYDLGPSTKSIVEEAARRGIPWRRLGKGSKIQLGYGKNQKQLRATMTCNTSAVAVDIAGDKDDAKRLLSEAGIPVAKGDCCRTIERMIAIINKVGFPIVIKPLNGNHGRGVSVNIQDHETAELAFIHAQEYSSYVIVEKFITGNDYRMLVIDGKFVAAAIRTPANITGDGEASVRELIEKVNKDSNRGNGHETVLTKIAFDMDTFVHLERLGYTYESIPKINEKLILKSTANLSTGGTAGDVTDEVHPDNRFMAERIATLVGLDICGIDIMAPSISNSITQNNGVVLEVNAAPGFRMHLSPSSGKSRNVAKAVVDMLYPPNSSSTIPLFAITGTNGKTTTTRLIAHIAKSAGYLPGYTTTDGIYIGNYKVKTGDTTGPLSAAIILQDPLVDFAILETARGGLLRSGLSFEQCDVGIITNIQEDHLGISDINNLEDLANVKAVVARSVKKEGWAVLNADDSHCINIAKEIECNVVYFSLKSDNPIIQIHLNNGGLAAVVEDDAIVIKNGIHTIFIENLNDIPLTQNGTAHFMTANVLAAAGATFAFGFTKLQIQEGLKTFLPSYEQTPGRMNLFKCKDFNVLVDYAHNPHGMLGLKSYLTTIEANRKIGIVAGVGDRRDEDIIELAKIAASMFDHIVVRQESGLRGRKLDEINNLMIKGMKEGNTNISYDLIADEKAAIAHALKIGRQGDFIVALSEMYDEVISEIRKYQ
ncbi:cyanophycin synthetase [Flavobacterium tegetincola]|uniref:cyanophycin synthetase n=1 Tax=Flavobacterium tegetincola TaxID=150172 RepID=UPI000479090C|nr:cyanophycin synthetase [Flavobacterium tegetincola]